MTPQVWFVFWNYYKMAHPRLDVASAAGADVELPGLVRLDDVDHDWIVHGADRPTHR
jgi:hypothetical protein